MPLMQPTSSQWVNPSSQFASQAQGYTGYVPPTQNSVNQFNNPNQNQSSGSSGLMSPDTLISGAGKVGKWAAGGFELPKIPELSSVNKVGEFFGLANPSKLQGPTLTGATLGESSSALSSSGSLSSGLASAALGFVGTKLGSLLGKGGVGADIGGTIGGLAGSYFGPVGSFVGSTIGSFIGGFFGGHKTPHPAAGITAYGIGADGTLTNAKAGAKHLDPSVGQALGDDFQSYLKNQAKAYGINYSGITGVEVATSPEFKGRIVLSTDPKFSPSGIQYASGGGTTSSDDKYKIFEYDPDNATSRNTAYKQAFDYAAQTSGVDTSKLPEISQTPVTGTGIMIKQKTQGSWNAFMQAQGKGTNNVPATT